MQETITGVTTKGISYRTKSLPAEETQQVPSVPSGESTDPESEPEEMTVQKIEESPSEVKPNSVEEDTLSEPDSETPTTTKIDSTTTETTDTSTPITPVSRDISVGKSSPEVRVTKLYVYPIKSCRPQSVDKVKLTPYGFENDLLFMIVDFTGRSVELNRCPLLVNLKPTVQDDGKLLLELSDENSIIHEPKPWGPHRSVMSEGKSYDAVDQGDDISRFLATGLELPGARLVRIRNENGSTGSGKRRANPQYEQGFKNNYSCVLSSDVSCKEKKEGFDEKMMSNDFHPNIMVGAVDVLEPFAENGWTQVTANGCNFVVKADKQMNETEISEDLIAFGKYMSVEGDVSSDTFLQIGDILSVS